MKCKTMKCENCTVRLTSTYSMLVHYVLLLYSTQLTMYFTGLEPKYEIRGLHAINEETLNLYDNWLS